MEYKYEYKDTVEREDILVKNKELFWIEEQNITEGNFLIFSDVQPQMIDLEAQDLSSRVLDISNYLESQTDLISDVENCIIQAELNTLS